MVYKQQFLWPELKFHIFAWLGLNPNYAPESENETLRQAEMFKQA